MIADIREFVRTACQQTQNVLGPSFFDQHLVVVAECATRLAERLSADEEVVELAAYLHDISAVLDPATLPDHPRQSAVFASRVLLGRGYTEGVAREVAHAIASHSDPLAIGSASPEEVCLSNADAVARILRPAYWMYFAFNIRKYGFEEGRQWLRSLIEKQWRALIEPAREFVGNRYATALELLAG